MNQLGMCILKEYTEAKRRFRLLIFLGVPLLLAVLVLTSNLALPGLIKSLPAELFTNGSSEGMVQLLENMLPDNVSDSMGMYAADIGLFYVITVIALTSGLVTGELKRKQWILPVCADIKPQNMLLAKYIVYGCMSAGATFLGYTFYYLFALRFFVHNMNIFQFLICGLVLSLAVLWVSILSIAISVTSKKQWIAAATMIGLTLLTPDILYLLKLGRFFPTFMFTYVYHSGEVSDTTSLVISALVAIIMMAGMIIWSLKKTKKLKEVERMISNAAGN